MMDLIWEGRFNDRYEVKVYPTTNDYCVRLELAENGQHLGHWDVPQKSNVKLGPAEEDIERWKLIVEEFTDEAKFGYN